MDKTRILNRIYYGNGAGAYGSIGRLTQAAKAVNPSITVTDVRTYLENQEGYQRTKQPVHDPIARHKSKRFHQASGVGELGADVIYLDKLPGPFKFGLVVTDFLTKQIIIQFMKTLSSKTAKEALIRALEEYPFQPKQIHTDAGREFLGEFDKYLKERNIEHIFGNPNVPWHIGGTERSVRTIREQSGRILASGKVKTPLEALKMSTSIHNKSANRLLNGKAPLDVKLEDVGRIVEHQLKLKRAAAESIPDMSKKFKVNDRVRVRLPKGPFTKSNEPRWSSDIYSIIDIYSSWPTPSYKLQSINNGTSLPGTFTYNQLQKLP